MWKKNFSDFFVKDENKKFFHAKKNLWIVDCLSNNSSKNSSVSSYYICMEIAIGKKCLLFERHEILPQLKNLSPLIRVRDLTMKFSMDIVFIQEYIRCFIISYTHADFDCKGLLLRTSYEKKIFYEKKKLLLLQEVIFFCKNSFSAIKIAFKIFSSFSYFISAHYAKIVLNCLPSR